MRVCLPAALAFVCSLHQIPAVAEQTPTTIRVGVERGTVILASAQTPEIVSRFITAAGGADSPIVFVPTANLQRPDAPWQLPVSNADPGAALKAAGAKNVVVLHTFDRKVADSNSFTEPIRHAAGVWFAGGMPENLLDTYAGTQAQVEFKNVLGRGGVVGGISAGATILGDETVNAALSPDRQWVMRKGFGLLRGVAFQPHAQTPKPDSWMLKRPDLLRIAADNATAWLVVGDVAEIIGGGSAYVYEETGTAGEPRSVTLRPGDRYDLAARVIRPADRR